MRERENSFRGNNVLPSMSQLPIFNPSYSTTSLDRTVRLPTILNNQDNSNNNQGNNNYTSNNQGNNNYTSNNQGNISNSDINDNTNN
jgi:hypothetical protein